MIFGSWNIKGLNKPFKQKKLKSILLKNKVVLIGFLEKVKANKAERIKRKLGADWQVDADYNSSPNSRIWVCWKPQQVMVRIISSYPQVVHCYVEDKYSRFACHTTYIYGYNTIEGRKQIWEKLKRISNNMTES